MADDPNNLPVDEAARRRFESLWQSGEPPSIDAFVPSADEPEFLGTLLELVHIDLEFSWKRGAYETANPPRIETYLARFPRLSSPEIVRDLLSEEHRIRRQLGGKPVMSEYQDRYRALFNQTLKGVFDGQDPADLNRTAPMPEPAPSDGHLPQINGYKVLSLLGSGGMGDVFHAVQLGTRREVAVKLMRRSLSRQGYFRFDREVQLTARLDHPNIARIFDSGSQQDLYFYAMELIIGKPLDEHVKASGMNERQILKIFQSICLAVAHAHLRGIIHRDLKPSNILVSADGTPHVVDFGLAKTVLQDEPRADGAKIEATIAGELAGTPAYMSPEQAAAKVDLDTRSDVYSLGVILYRLLTRQFPHAMDGDYLDILGRIRDKEVRRPRLANPQLDREMESLLLKALAKSPDDRYASAGELAHDVGNYLNGEPLTAQPATIVYFLRKRLWKYRFWLGAAAGVILGLAVIAIAVTAQMIHERNVAVAADHRSTLKAAEAENERRKARLSEAESLLAHGDLLGSSGRWREAGEKYQDAWNVLKAESAGVDTADIALWNTCRVSPPPLWRVPGGPGPIMDVALSADGRVAFAGGQDGRVGTFDLTTGHSPGRFAGHNGCVWAVAMTGDAKTGFSGGADGAIKTWDLRRMTGGGAERPLGQVAGWVTGLALSPDESRIASISGESEASLLSPRDFTITVWAAHPRVPASPICSFKAAGRVTRIAFSPDGSVLLTAGEELAAWDCQRGQKLRVFGDHAAGISSAVFSGDGLTFCAGDTEGVVKTWEFKSGKLLASLKVHDSLIVAMTFCDGGKNLASVGEDQSLRIIDLASGEVIRTCGGSERRARCFNFSGDNRFGLCAEFETSALTFWAIDAPVESIALEPARYPCDSITFLADDRLALCGGREGMVIHDIPTGRKLSTPQWRWPAADGLAVSPSARRIASVSGQVLRLWDFPSLHAREVSINRKGHQPVPIAFSPDGTLLLAALSPDTLSIRDGKSGAELRALTGNGNAVASVAFSPDGKLALSGGHEGTAILWDVSTGRELRRFIGHTDGINAVAFAPDGLTAVTASGNSSLETRKDDYKDDYSVRRWDVATGALLQTFLGHAAMIRAVAYNRDGTLIASAGEDRQIKLWRVETGRELRTIVADAPVHCLAFSGTGQLISGGDNGVARLWDFSTSAQRRLLQKPVESAMRTLQLNPADATALTNMSRWYAFHRAWDWAGDTLQRASAAGAATDRLTLARCHWMTGQFDQAIAEFRAAADKHVAPGDYVALCIQAIEAERQSKGGPATAGAGK